MSAMANNNDKDIAQFEQALKKQSEDKLEFLLAHTDANLEKGRYEAIEKELESRRGTQPAPAPTARPVAPKPQSTPVQPASGLGRPLGAQASKPSIQPPTEPVSGRRSLLKRRDDSGPMPEPSMPEPPRKSLKIKNYRTQATLNTSSDDEDLQIFSKPKGGGFFIFLLVVAMVLIATSAGILSIMLFDLPGKAEVSGFVSIAGQHAADLADKVMALVNKS